MKLIKNRVFLKTDEEIEDYIGLTSENFGIIKDEKSRFSVVHLPTALKVYSFSKQKQARKWVEFVENDPEMPCSWGTTVIEALQENIVKARDYKDIIAVHNA